VFAGIFLGTLAMLNILGISRFIKLLELETSGGAPLVFAIAVGVLPYPITFLCTDFISEFYGRKRANFVVFVGLLLNIWVIIIIWLGGMLPGFETIDPTTGAIVRDAAGRLPVVDNDQSARRHHGGHPHHPLLRPRSTRRSRAAIGAPAGSLHFHRLRLQVRHRRLRYHPLLHRCPLSQGVFAA
jgi:hypothetical protein